MQILKRLLIKSVFLKRFYYEISLDGMSENLGHISRFLLIAQINKAKETKRDLYHCNMSFDKRLISKDNFLLG